MDHSPRNSLKHFFVQTFSLNYLDTKMQLRHQFHIFIFFQNSTQAVLLTARVLSVTILRF